MVYLFGGGWRTGRGGLPVWWGMEDRSWWFTCLVWDRGQVVVVYLFGGGGGQVVVVYLFGGGGGQVVVVYLFGEGGGQVVVVYLFGGVEDRSWWFTCLVGWRTGRGGLPVWWGGGQVVVVYLFGG